MAKTEDSGASVVQALASIDAKLSALLVISLDQYLRSTEGSRTKERTIDRMLIDSGLPASTVASLLGKTARAVHLSLQRERRKTANKKRRPTKTAKRK
jgi:hypothetical protein